MIQLHRLEGFFRVATAGGYTRAAKTFPYPITQPGVHQQVHKLEIELGIRLFVRVGRDRVEPTPAGRRLLDFCTPFFEGLPRVTDEIVHGRYGGTLRVDAAALEIRHVLPAWIRRLRERRPDIRIELEEVPTADLTRLSNGKTDLVVEFVEEVPAGFGQQRVGTHYVFLVLPRAHAVAKRKRLTLAACRDQAFITFHPSLPHARRQLHAVEQVGPPRDLLSASSTEGILGFVAAGLGYSLIPWPTEHGPRVEGVRAERMRGPNTEYPILAIWKQRPTTHPLIEEALLAAGG